MSSVNEKRMDWHLVWTALSVLVPLLIVIICYGNSFKNQMHSLDKRLVAIETVMITQGYNIKGIAINNIEEKK